MKKNQVEEDGDVPEQDEPIDFSLKHSDNPEEGNKSPVFSWHTPLVTEHQPSDSPAQGTESETMENNISENMQETAEVTEGVVSVKRGFVLGEVAEYISRKESLEETEELDEEQSLKQAAAALMDMSNLNVSSPPSTPTQHTTSPLPYSR